MLRRAMERLRCPHGIIAMIAAGAVLAACNIDVGIEPDPYVPPKALYPSGTQERGATFTVTSTRVVNPTTGLGLVLGPTEVAFDPADAVTWDAATARFTWVKLGSVTLREAGVAAPLTSTVNVVEAPTIYFDMEVDGNRDVYSATLRGLELRRLTTDPAADVHPTSLGGMVVFSSNRDGNFELYSLPAGLPGTDTRLTFTAANETEPELSPNGSSLVYVRDDGSTLRLWLSTASAAGATLLTNAPAGAREGGPRWWKTSDNILFHSQGPTGVASLYRTAPVAGSTPVPYAKSAGGDSAYREPEPVELTSASAAIGAFLFVAADAAGKSRIHLGSVDYQGTARLGYAPVTPAGMLAGEPRFVSGRVVYTIYEADGSSSLAWVTMPGGSLFSRIPLPGTNPRHPSGRP